MSDNKFIPGLFFKDKNDKAPDFVLCKGSIKVADMVAWLTTQEGEWVNFDLKRSRDGKPYAAIDDWKPSGERAAQREKPVAQNDLPERGEFKDDDIPF